MDDAELIDELFEALQTGIGFLEGGLVHAYTPAYRRLPKLYQRRRTNFLVEIDVRVVLEQVTHQLDARLTSGSLTGPRVEEALDQLRRLAPQLPPLND